MTFDEWMRYNLCTEDSRDGLGQAILEKCRSAYEAGYLHGKEEVLKGQ